MTNETRDHILDFCIGGAFCLPFGPRRGIVPSTYDEESGCLIGDVVALTNAIHNVQKNGVIVLSNGVYDVSFLTNAPSGTYESNNAGLSLLTSGGKSGVTIRGFTGNPENVVLDGNGACYRVIAKEYTRAHCRLSVPRRKEYL